MLFAENKTVSDGQIEKEPEYVFIAFATLEAYMIVSSQLIAAIYAAHEVVVVGDRERTRIR